MLPLLALAAAATVQIPTGTALTEAIAARDADFFRLYFLGCDPARAATFLTPDFEMYHDRGGKIAGGAAPFLADYATQCEAKKKPDAWRSRRELVARTLHVEAIPGFGAIEEGDHVFYERRGDGPEKLVGKAHFLQLWQLTADGWRIARVFSYSHQALDAK